jgi:hypothetical protein
MPRLWLDRKKRSFIDLRPVHRPECFGLSVLLRVGAMRDCSGFMVHKEFLWCEKEALLDVIRRFLTEGNMTLPGKPSDAGIQFRIQYVDDDVSVVLVSCLTDDHHAEFRLEIATQAAWRFFVRLMSVCERV